MEFSESRSNNTMKAITVTRRSWFRELFKR